MGVSDGVYAWREKGIDAGAFSQKLMEYARLSVSMGTTDVLRGERWFVPVFCASCI